MFLTLLEKELKAILLSPKFAITFLACSILILLSVFIGIKDYQSAIRQYETATQLTDQQIRESTSWHGVNSRAFRQPDPMQIFVSGVNNDIGRYSIIRSSQSVKLQNSNYSDDPIFAVFRYIDLTFIFQVVLSLFAILFTFDAINGEREGGTLQLTFANAVPRAKYLMAKFFGSLIALIVPLLIPLLLGCVLVLVFRVPFTNDHWLRLLFWLGVSFLFFTTFVSMGLLISALVRRSSVSFLISLVVWVVFVLIIPRASVIAAGQFISVPSVGEIDGQQDGFAKQRWDNYREKLMARWQERSVTMEGMNEGERESFRDDNEWGWMQEDDKARNAVEQDIDEFSSKLLEDVRNRRQVQERMAFTLSRFSPASAYQLAAMNLGGTNIILKSRYEDAMNNYRDTFKKYVAKKQEEGGSRGGIRITISSETGFNMSSSRDKGTLDVTDLPRFEASLLDNLEAISPTIIDFGLLAFYTVLSFAGAFVAFLRYDVR